jgi:hypothetical protein
LTAETFEAALVADLPEVTPELQKLRESWGDDEPGLHVVVGDVLTPYVSETVDLGDTVRLSEACAFLEGMATSKHERVRNALTVSLLERLGDDPARLDTARAAMGPQTLALSREIERFWGREP